MPNQKFNRFFVSLVSFLLIFVVGFIFGASYYKNLQQNQFTNTEAGIASVMFDFGNGKVKTFSQNITATTSVYMLLQSMEKEKINIEYKDFGGSLGVFLNKVDGVGSDPQGDKWWQYWVNNKYADRGISSYIVKPGDTVEFKFIKGQVN